MDVMMRNVLHAHNNASKLEQEMSKERANMMNENCDWYIIKTKFVGLAAEHKKETDKILAILEAKAETETAESVDEYADITENTNDLASSTDDSEVNSLFNESIPINEEQFIQRSASRISVKVDPEPTPEPTPQPKAVPQMSSKPVQFVTVSQATLATAKVQSKPKPKPKKKKTITPVAVISYNTGYKYGGKGFDVYTGFKNNSKPIYASTTLYCRETKSQNKKLLKEYLVEEGKFGGKTAIESISFGYGRYGEDVAYIRVRGAMKTIKNKIRQLNNKNGAVLSICGRKQNFSAREENNTLFVNNFDITDKTVHRRFTNLFLKYGQLAKDIKMGIDKNNDPYAIVSFVDLSSATACYKGANEIYYDDGRRRESSIYFGAKTLSVSYAKRM